MVANSLYVGKNLARARKEVGFTQRDLAQQSGISQPTIHRIEKDQREATVAEIAVLADACGVLASDLTGRTSLANEVRCAARTDDTNFTDLFDYLIYAFALSQRLDELSVPEIA
ncbi:MAG: helix-turn-helix transcriptional regulator [Actinomycetaceae bacterium]|nr:helix-turn-helix transcriptional regulator [Actinomycetaceae bacterium]